MAVLEAVVDDKLYDTLRKKATRKKCSIEQQVVEIIQRDLDTPELFQCDDDAALALAGSWIDERTTEEIIKDIYESRTTRRVHEEL